MAENSPVLVWLSIFVAVLAVAACVVLLIRGRRHRSAEKDMDRFFNLSLDLLCISGMDGYFKRLSKSYEQTLGYSLQELYSRPVVEFVHPDDVQRTSDEIVKQMAGNKVMSFENRFRHKDGGYRILSWKSVPVGDLMYAVARDVTAQKEFEAQLMEAREAAMQAAVAKSAFLANMSHEIRTPLNGVIGISDLLSRSTLNSKQSEFVTAIRSSATLLLKVVNEVLDFSKLEAGRMRLEKVDFDLLHLVEDQISLIGVLANEKGLSVESNIDSRIPQFLHGDSNKIRQVLLNLLSNAVKFTEKGTVVIHGELVSKPTTYKPGEVCRIRLGVRDQGIGIDPTQAKGLFEPFVQADISTSRQFGGTGLGLSICKRLVETMGGEIGFKSYPGVGSEFWFEMNLPIAKAVDEYDMGAPGKPAAPLDASTLERRKAMRVLIAEDNKMNQMIVMNMMSALGYSAFLAKNGQEAVDMFRREKFDLVLMDQHMPVMDGMQASREIRDTQKEGERRTPIIAFTATVLHDDQMTNFRHLMDDYILKPVTLDALESKILTWEKRLAQ